jgi:membrane fusion protein (multidrug efflux system)
MNNPQTVTERMHWWTVGRFLESTDDAYVGGDITVISPKVPGYILSASVTDNQFVHAGDLLVKIDDRDYRAALEQGRGAVAGQQAVLANLARHAQLQQAVISQAKAGVDAAAPKPCARATTSALSQPVRQPPAVSVQSFAARRRRLQAGRGQRPEGAGADARRRARARRDRHAPPAGARRAGPSQGRARHRRLNLGYTELRAPIDGVIGNRARTGALCRRGLSAAVHRPARGLWVDANFKERPAGKVPPRPGRDHRGRRVPGRYSTAMWPASAPATGAQFSVLPPENATGNFTKIVQRVPVRIVLDDADGVLGLLRPGLSVIAEVDTARRRNLSASSRGKQAP